MKYMLLIPINVLVFPIVFLAGVSFPVDTVPAWMEVLPWFNQTLTRASTTPSSDWVGSRDPPGNWDWHGVGCARPCVPQAKKRNDRAPAWTEEGAARSPDVGIGAFQREGEGG